MRNGEPPEMSTTTSSYETALTTTSRNRDKESAKEQARVDSARGSLPSAALAPVSETMPEWLESPDPGSDQAEESTGGATTECSPAVKVPSDQWLPRRLSQLGIPYVPRTGEKTSTEPTREPSKQTSGEHFVKLSGGPTKEPSKKHSREPSEGPSNEPSKVTAKETLKQPCEDPTRKFSKQRSKECSKSSPQGHSETPARKLSKTTSKEQSDGPYKEISKEPSGQTSCGASRKSLVEPFKKSFEAAFKKSSQRGSKEHCKEPFVELFERPSTEPSKAASRDPPAKSVESFARATAEPAAERTGKGAKLAVLAIIVVVVPHCSTP
ncbi:uncharacterized protein [Dermacentor andersoni]|uniref:uncharacterized protein n=1 Tax=Dermacentor andersoni TaxID=34620 RepID=UPI003B3ACF6C